MSTTLHFSLQRRLTLGIDIAEETVRGVLVTHRREGLSLIRSTEVDLKASQESDDSRCWSDGLHELLKRFSLARVHVNVSLPAGSYFIARYQLPNAPAKKIGEMILEKLEDHRLSFPLEESTISYVSQPHAPRGSYLVACAPKGLVSEVLAALNAAGATSFFILPSDMTVLTGILTSLGSKETLEKQQTIATLRIGRKESALTFYDDEGFRLRRVIPLGKNDVLQTRHTLSDRHTLSERHTLSDQVIDSPTDVDLVSRLPVENTPIQDRASTSTDPPTAGKDTVLQTNLGRVVSSIQKTLHFYRNRVGNSGVSTLYLLDDFRGLGTIESYFADKLQIEVRFYDGLHDLPFIDKPKQEFASRAESACYSPATSTALELKGDLSLVPKEELFLPRLRLFRSITRLTTGVLTLIMILLGVFYNINLHKHDALTEQAKSVSDELDRILQQDQMAESMLAKKQEQEQVLADIMYRKGRITKILKELSRIASPYASVERLDISLVRVDAALHMHGVFVAKEPDSRDRIRSSFINILEASPLLENISVQGDSWKRKGNFWVSSFILTADLSPTTSRRI